MGVGRFHTRWAPLKPAMKMASGAASTLLMGSPITLPIEKIGVIALPTHHRACRSRPGQSGSGQEHAESDSNVVSALVIDLVVVKYKAHQCHPAS